MKVKLISIITGLSLLALFVDTQAARISDVANTLHNLSSGAGHSSVQAVSEQQICAFCHTPHGANIAPAAPLWNRKLEGDAGYAATYTMYDSASMDSSILVGTAPIAPSNSSKLCLSCHDGVIAIGAVNVMNGMTNQLVTMNGTNTDGTMPSSRYGKNSGNTRNLGTDLSNDHPISITYDSTLASTDGELFDPLASPHVGVRGGNVRPLIPLIPDPLDGNKPKLECVSCHDPHIRDDSGTDIKFLRLNRFQTTTGPSGQGGNPNLVNFNETNDIICLACHNKEGWVDSAHANELSANEAYNNTAATERDFPLGIQVWQAACLNCHDTHTVAGSRRLLREGTTDTPPGGQVIKAGGGAPAIEETCYQCHSNDADPYYALNGTNPEVPDIKSDFQLARHMPITTTEQAAGAEVHNIGNTGNSGDGKDMIESPLTLGKGNLMNRHAECTDCHNPHRVTKNRLATDDPTTPSAAGTHDHELTESTMHTNLISGALRGTWGVEPVYGATAFTALPISYTVKKGVPPQNGSNLVTESYVTREYQVCLKCHSDYGFDNITPPALGTYIGGTPSGTNGVTHYTNQAMEFQAPSSHMGSPLMTTDSGAHSGTTVSGHRYRSFKYIDLKWTEMVDEEVNTLFGDCDGEPHDDPSCVCVECKYGGSLGMDYSTMQYITACGSADANIFSSNGTPGYSDSPWGGTYIDRRYSGKICSKTVDFSSNNHRSWHPVMKPTGRTPVERSLGGNSSAFLAPWDASVGNQTMYCSDCHGSDTNTATAVPIGGENGNSWGPHGSQNDFLLKGGWSNLTGEGSPNDLCFKCHDYNAYGRGGSSAPSGFSTSYVGDLCALGGTSNIKINLHSAHAAPYPWATGNYRCTACHTALPHGWKNKALLVNLFDVGPEVGLNPGTVIPATEVPYNNGPYYLNAVNYIYNFSKSGEWTKDDCGSGNSSGAMSMLGSCSKLP